MYFYESLYVYIVLVKSIINRNLICVYIYEIREII